MIRLISNQINPHFTFKDTLLLWRQILSPKAPLPLSLPEAFLAKKMIFTTRAREVLYLLAQAFDLPKGSGVGLPAFSCAVMATPFLAAGYRIIWIDTDSWGRMDFEDFSRKAKDVQVVLIPHTFGMEVDLKPFYEVCKKQHIFLIEDLAHSVNTDYRYCDAKLFSFGREKLISCVSGGALAWQKPHPALDRLLKRYYELPFPPKSWEWRHGLVPLIFSLSLPWWRAGGKALPALARALKLFPPVITEKEREGRFNGEMYRLPESFLRVLSSQVFTYSKHWEHKALLAERWKAMLQNLGIPSAHIGVGPSHHRVVVRNLSPQQKEAFLNVKGFFLREWDGVPIAPKGVNLSALGYKKGMCPKAEAFAKTYLTLPLNKQVKEKHIKYFAQALDWVK